MAYPLVIETASDFYTCCTGWPCNDGYQQNFNFCTGMDWFIYTSTMNRPRIHYLPFRLKEKPLKTAGVKVFTLDDGRLMGAPSFAVAT